MDLHPKLVILFPRQLYAAEYAASAIQTLGDIIEVQLDGTVVTITGADHPELRADLMTAAKLLGGDQIPERKNS